MADDGAALDTGDAKRAAGGDRGEAGGGGFDLQVTIVIDEFTPRIIYSRIYSRGRRRPKKKKR